MEGRAVAFLNRGLLNASTTSSPASITFVSSAEQAEAAGGTSFSFVGQLIGTAAADRFMIVGATTADGTAASANIASLLIANVTAALIAQGGAGTLNRAGLFGLTVTSGTTATIVVNMSASIGGSPTIVPVTIGVWYARGLLSTTAVATNAAYATSGSLTLGLASSAQGVAVAAATNWSGAAPTWSGYDSTKDWTQSGSGAPTDASGISGTTSGASLTITYGSVGTQGSGASATFR